MKLHLTETSRPPSIPDATEYIPKLAETPNHFAQDSRQNACAVIAGPFRFHDATARTHIQSTHRPLTEPELAVGIDVAVDEEGEAIENEIALPDELQEDGDEAGD